MCPACFTTVALVAAGTTSAAGLTALAVTKLRARIGAKVIVTVRPSAEQREAQPDRGVRRVAVTRAGLRRIEP